MAYNDRNPVWVLGGIEKDSDKGKIIQWTQPEILLYDDDPMIRMSYPDLVEDKGNYYITETQKDLAKVHPIDKQFLDGLWGQFGSKKITEDGLVATWSDKTGKFPQKVTAPSLPDFSVRNNAAGDYRSKNTEKGFTIDMEFSLNDLSAGQIMLDARDVGEKGWHVRTTDKKTIEIVLNDGRTQSAWSCDEGMLKEKQNHRVSVVVDGGPRVISFVVDGILNDGGDTRQFGWGRFNPYLQSVSGAKDIRIGSGIHGSVKTVRIYNRALKTSEVIGNQNAGK
jgi:hypothetical protein